MNMVLDKIQQLTSNLRTYCLDIRTTVKGTAIFTSIAVSVTVAIISCGPLYSTVFHVGNYAAVFIVPHISTIPSCNQQ